MQFRVDTFNDETEVSSQNLLVWGDHEKPIKAWNYSKRFADDIVRTYQANLLMPLFQLDNPKSLLLIGVAGGSMAPAIKKIHPNIKITGVDLEPKVKDMTAQMGTRRYFDEIHIKDGFDFLETTKEQYDVILIDILVPNLADNKEFTPENNPLSKSTNPSYIENTIMPLLSENGLLLITLEVFEDFAKKLGQEWFVKSCIDLKDKLEAEITSIHDMSNNRFFYKDINRNVEKYVKYYNDFALVKFKDNTKISLVKIYGTIIEKSFKDIAIIQYTPLFFAYRIMRKPEDMAGGRNFTKFISKLRKHIASDEGKSQIAKYSKMEKLI